MIAVWRLAVLVVGSLAGISQALNYALARLLGVAQPGGVGGQLIEAAAGPLSVAVVYGAGWAHQRAISLYHWRVVRREAQEPAADIAPPPRHAGALVELEAPTSAMMDAALASLRDQGITVRATNS